MPSSTFTKIRLGIVCPMANERDNAVDFVRAVLGVCRSFSFQEIQFFTIFDRVCTDGTCDLLRDSARQIPELRVVYAEENRSVVDAYMRGYREAILSECDWILEIDAGFSHQPEDIPLFFATMAEGYDSVFGSRFIKGARFTETPLKRYLISRGGSLLTNWFLGTRLKDMASGFELFTREALAAILRRGIHSRGPFFQTEIRTFAHDFRIKEVPIHYRAGNHPVSNKTLQDAFTHLKRLRRMRKEGTLWRNNPA